MIKRDYSYVFDRGVFAASLAYCIVMSVFLFLLYIGEITILETILFSLSMPFGTLLFLIIEALDR